MHVISGKEAIKLIEGASAIIIMDDNRAMCVACIEDLSDDEDEFWNVDAEYVDDELCKYEYGFKIWGDDSIPVIDDMLMLNESDGREPVGVKLLIVQKI